MIEKVCGPTPASMIKMIRSRDYEKWFDHSQLPFENPPNGVVDLSQNSALVGEIRKLYEQLPTQDNSEGQTIIIPKEFNHFAQIVYNKFELPLEDAERIFWANSISDPENPDPTNEPLKEKSVSTIAAMLGKKVGTEGLQVTENNGATEFKILEMEKKKSYLKWPGGVRDTESIDYVKNMRMINDVVTSREPELRDLLRKLLEVDPLKR